MGIIVLVALFSGCISTDNPWFEGDDDISGEWKHEIQIEYEDGTTDILSENEMLSLVHNNKPVSGCQWTLSAKVSSTNAYNRVEMDLNNVDTRCTVSYSQGVVDGPTLILSDVQMNVGGVSTMDVTIQNVENIVACQIYINYDETVISVEDLITTTSSFNNVFPYADNREGFASFIAYNIVAMSGDMTVGSIVFKGKSLGITEIEIMDSMIYDEENDIISVAHNRVSGTATVGSAGLGGNIILWQKTEPTETMIVEGDVDGGWFEVLSMDVSFGDITGWEVGSEYCIKFMPLGEMKFRGKLIDGAKGEWMDISPGGVSFYLDYTQ